eukprot:861396-Rhodomonas_salina.1
MPAQATITLAATPSFMAKASNALMFVRLATAQVGIDWVQTPGSEDESSDSNRDGSYDDDDDDSDDDDNCDRPVGRAENDQPTAHG